MLEGFSASERGKNERQADKTKNTGLRTRQAKERPSLKGFDAYFSVQVGPASTSVYSFVFPSINIFIP